MQPTASLALVAALAAALALGAAVLRRVPAGHRGVVVRAGRAVRSRAPGVLGIVPGLERVEMVPLHPTPIDPLGVVALTRDGVEVRLVLSVLWGVSDAMRSAELSVDARSATANAVERTAHHLVAEVDLSLLLRDREAFVRRILATAGPLLAPCGVALADVLLLDAEVYVGPQLLRLLG